MSVNLFTMLSEARRLRQLGLSVFPIHAPGMPLPWGGADDQAGKIPLISWKPYQERLPSDAEVGEWWTQWPEANVAIVSGAISGVIVLDVDGKEGMESLRRFSPLPATWHSLTGRGEHFWFRHPGGRVGNFARRLPGLDLRGDGGYAVVPPSRHRTGRTYQWLVSPDQAGLADSPAWLLALIDPGPAPDNGGGNRFTVSSSIPEGQRNDQLYRLARSLKAKGLSDQAILAALHVENTSRCAPPLSREEVSEIANHAATQPDRQDFQAMCSEEEDEGPEAESLTAVLPESAWRGPFADYRAAMEGKSEAPDTAHFSALWVAAATRLRRRVHFYYAFPHYPNVFVVNYGGTGESKTSTMRHSISLLPTDGRVKVLRGVGSAEALGDWMKQPEHPLRVSHLIFLEELATTLTRSRWDGSTLLQFLTETFDAPDVFEIPYRKNPVKVEEPTPSLLAGTTPAWFWKSMQEIDIHGGFGNRLLFLTGAPKAPVPMPGRPDPHRLQRVLGALHALDEVHPGEMRLTDGATHAWEDFYIAWKKTEWDPLTTAAVKRIPAYILKLAMLYACFEQTAPAIGKDQLLAAIEVGYFSAQCAAALMTRQRQHTVQGRCEERILKVLAGENLPPWQIHQRISGQFTAEELGRALRALLATGAIRELGKTRRGEPIYGLRGRLRS